MQKVKQALEYAICVFDTLHNTQTYQGDNQDFSDEIITMLEALAELEQAKQEPAQAVPVDAEAAFRDYACRCRTLWAGLEWDNQVVEIAREAYFSGRKSNAPLGSDTRKMVLELCRNVMKNIASWSLADDAEAILEKLEAGA